MMNDLQQRLMMRGKGGVDPATGGRVLPDPRSAEASALIGRLWAALETVATTSTDQNAAWIAHSALRRS
jgi:hypothetical protein